MVLTPEQWILIIGSLTGVASAVFVGINGLRTSKAGIQTSKASIDARIDARVDREMERLGGVIDEQASELRDLKAELKTATEKLEVLERRDIELKHMVKKWWADLRLWEYNKRTGPMPMPSDDDMVRLDLATNTGEIPIAAE